MSGQHPATQAVGMLDALDLVGLRQAWEARFGAPPITRSSDLLRTLLAWKIQAEAFGGLDRTTLAALRRTSPISKPGRLPQGVRLAREWRGVRHEVDVVGEGFHHEGQTYHSLSQVARVITVVRWNGPRFFGLRSGAAS